MTTEIIYEKELDPEYICITFDRFIIFMTQFISSILQNKDIPKFPEDIMDLLKTYKELGGDEIIKGYNEIVALVKEAQKTVRET